MNVDREALRTGIPLIDRQHDEYFDRLEELIGMTEGGHVERGRLEAAMAGVLEYAIEHFDAEESLMRSVGYPKLEEHRAKHDVFRAEVDRWTPALRQEWNMDTCSALIGEWLVQWVADQIQADDQLLAAFLKDTTRLAHAGAGGGNADRRPPG